MLTLVLLGLAPVLAPTVPVQSGPTFALRATRVHVGDGTVIENGIVLVADGVVRDVADGLAVPPDVPLVELAGELSPGMIALVDYSGTGAEGRDSTRQVSPTMDLSFAFDPDHRDMRRLVEEGITTVVLAPSPGSLVGGLAAVVKPGVGVLARGALLQIDLSRSALSFNQFPTSYAGAFEELDRLFAEPTGPIERAARGEQRVLIAAESRAEMQRAVDFALRYHLAGVLVAGPRVGELAARVKASGLAVALAPHNPGDDRRGARSAAALAAAGVPFGFALGAPRNAPATLRLTAAAAVREGLARDAALRALTVDAAAAAGVGERVGRVASGLAADLVLWSGDPVDPASRVLGVWIDGASVVSYVKPDDEDDEGDER